MNDEQNNLLKISARCAECSGYFTIESTPICQPCFINHLKIRIDSGRKTRLLFESRKFAYQIMIVTPMLYAVGHYFGNGAQIACDCVFLVGVVLNSFTNWLAGKI